MKLVAFSVTNYRSITTANRLPIGQSTILIGPNNEGKSNILRALVTALDVLRRISGARILRGRVAIPLDELYNWESDFPISLQTAHPNGESSFDLQFRLTEEEVNEFFAEVGSKLNGELPIKLTVGKKPPGFKVTKKGPGAIALSNKAESIAQFISRRINLSYIPAVRTASSAHRVVERLLERELATIEGDPAFREALESIARLQRPVLDRISVSIKQTLNEFLPNVKDVRVSVPEEARSRALRRSCSIVVDDGTPTELSRKGDGVQSLSALSLMRHASLTSGLGRNLILALEEPESHLHPSAIHQLRGVIAEIAQRHQVIMTTHCPLFVSRTNLKANIIVHHNRARPARDIKEVRNILGVRAADNLQHADLILLVEGESDRRAIRSLLAAESPLLRSAITEGTLGVDTLQGGSNLSYKLGQVRDTLCTAYSFLDDDKCGRDAASLAIADGLATWADITLATCPGMQESELEDLYDVSHYSPMLHKKFGVLTECSAFKGKGKWSDRVARAFKHHGKAWNAALEGKVKAEVSELVEATPSNALHPNRRNAFDALVYALTERLTSNISSTL